MNDSDNQSEVTQEPFLARMDRWMAAHPWHPRVVPLLVYLVLLMVIGFARDSYPVSYPFLYTFQCLLVCWLMWRYRKLTPELNVKFHWLCIPVGVFVAVPILIVLRAIFLRDFP